MESQRIQSTLELIELALEDLPSSTLCFELPLALRVNVRGLGRIVVLNDREPPETRRVRSGVEGDLAVGLFH